MDYLSKLPTEILLEILKECTCPEPWIHQTRRTDSWLIFSLCAGLTCKRIYNVHFSLWGKINLKQHSYGLIYYIPKSSEGECCMYWVCNPECPGIQRKVFVSYALLHDWFTAGGYEERLGFGGCRYRKIRDMLVTKPKRKRNRGHGRWITIPWWTR